ncbi:hypothetical protein ACQB6R_13290 [Propionibacteriaceae bacterium G1746]
MAEIRKFAPGRGGDIAQALAKAMGEGVRPATPGAGDKPAPRSKAPAAGPTATSGALWDPFLKATPAKVVRKSEKGEDEGTAGTEQD